MIEVKKNASLNKFIDIVGINKVLDWADDIRSCDDIFKLKSVYRYVHDDYELNFVNVLPVFEKALEVYGTDYPKATREDIINIYEEYFK